MTEWFGIYSICCKENIKLIGTIGSLGQCQECKRVFIKQT